MPLRVVDDVEAFKLRPINSEYRIYSRVRAATSVMTFKLLLKGVLRTALRITSKKYITLSSYKKSILLASSEGILLFDTNVSEP